MAVDSIIMTSLSATVVGPSNPDGRTVSATLTVFTNPQTIVSAQISIARQAGQWTAAEAFIPRISLSGGLDLDLRGGSPSIIWAGVESITFELDVHAAFFTYSNFAPILIAESAI